VTRVLVAAVVVAQLLDLATWMAMPRAAEVNPIAIGLHTQSAWLAKGALVLLVLGIQPALRPKYSAVGELVAVVAIAAGCVGAGSNLAVLSYVDAAPTSALLAIPTGDLEAHPRAVESKGMPPSGTDAARTPAPRQSATGATDLRGRASWYAADGFVAAAGPALRRALGRGWRGTLVRVSAGGRSVTVRLSDWCQCYRGTSTERLLDLSNSAFAAIAPLSTGLVDVRIRTIVPPATDR
jgi:hypothetical protein